MKIKKLLLTISGCCLLLMGCGGSDDPAQLSNTVPLPVGATSIDLYCADAGIYPETCVLDDPDNPFLLSDINEESKWDLNNSMPATLDYAKARFYLWATALARVPTGENQYYAANALHELYTYSSGSSANAQDQAIRAYRSVLDNFYDSITYWEATWIDPVNPPLYAIPLKDLTGQRIYDPTGGGLLSLYNDPFYALDDLAEWGYSFDPTVGAGSLSGVGTLD